MSAALRSLYDAGHFQQLSEVAAALDDDLGWLWLDILAARYSSEEMHKVYINACFIGTDEDMKQTQSAYFRSRQKLQSLLDRAALHTDAPT